MQTQTKLFVFVLACLGAVATLCQGKYVTMQGSFVQRDDKLLVNASLLGKFYYLYDFSDGNNSRVRYEYSVGGVTVSNLYDYRNNSIYSMCTSSCTGTRIYHVPDKWWVIGTSDSKVEQDMETKWYWYERSTASDTMQLKRILVANEAEPEDSSFQIAGVEFFDGRKLRIDPQSVKVNKMTNKDAKFDTDKGLNCPRGTCPMYADLVFVVDNSGSVDSNEWKQQINFVEKTIDSFTLGNDAVYAGLIQFRAPYQDCYSWDSWWGRVHVYNPDQMCPEKYTSRNPREEFGAYSSFDYSISWRPTADCYFSKYCTSATQDEKATVLMKLQGEGAASFIKNGVSRPENGNTCQGYGLKLALNQLGNDNPRKNNANKPASIVIAVTDGFDMCPNYTAQMAQELKNSGALLIEVGVGMQSRYDENFLRSIASQLSGNGLAGAAYYSVEDYSKISKVADELFKPLCEMDSTVCGKQCKGFCGCGQCFCPDCDTPSDSCYKSECEARDGTSSGCVQVEDPCDFGRDDCTTWTCNGKKPKAERCEATKETCGSENLKKCQSVQCSKIGGCSAVMNNHRMCDTGNKCETWECTGDDDSDENGCKKVAEKSCADATKGWPCLTATCNPLTGACDVTDECKQYENKCFTAECTAGGCVFKNTTAPETNKCTASLTCNNQTGWRQVMKTAETCKEEFVAQGNPTACRVFSCDPAEGCQMKARDNCDQEVCTEEAEAECQAQVKHTVTTCQTAHCAPKRNGEFYVPSCVIEDMVCERQGPCENAYCDVEAGKCMSVPIEDPFKDQLADNQCYESVCNAESNQWEVRENALAQACQTDGCATRTCVNETGCRVESTCRSSNCTTRTCVDHECVEEPVVCPAETRCQYSLCTEEAGGCRLHDKDPEVACADGDMCTVKVCNTRTNECENYAKPAPGTDKCVVYECDNKTGTWTERPKCDDGLYCTEDRCSYDGVCSFPPLECLDLSMEGFVCFQRSCSERRHCYRRLYQNAYVDICGNCIRTDDGTGSEEINTESADETCLDGMGTETVPAALTAAAVAAIVIVAVVVGIALTVSGIFGTKELVRRAQGANNQSAHSNPLFEDNEQELTNPAFVGETQ